MPITLKKDVWKVKDPSSGQYRGAAILSTTLPQDAAQIISESNDTIQNIKDTAIEAVDTALNDENTGLIPKAEADRDAIDDSLNNVTDGIIPTAQSDRDDIDDSLNNIEDGIIPTAQANLATIAQAVQSQIGQGTDKTLSVAKGFADAKAAGMLVKVSNYQPGSALDDPATSQDASQNTGYPVYKDSNRVWVKETYAELEVPTMDDVDELKSAINEYGEIIGNGLIAFTPGGYIQTSYGVADISSPNANQNYRYAVVPCSEGDKFTISAKGASAGRAWAFITSAGNVIAPQADANVTVTNFLLTAPANAVYLIINDNNTATNSYYGEYIKDTINGFTEDITTLQEAVSAQITPDRTSFCEPSEEDQSDIDILTGITIYPGYITSTGGIRVANADYQTTGQISVVPGSTYKIDLSGGANQVLVTWFDADGVTGTQINLGFVSANTKTVNGVCPSGKVKLAISVSSSGATTAPTRVYNLTPVETFDKFTMPDLVLPASGLLPGKTICNFGDSLFGQTRPPFDVSTKLANLTGATVYNCGFGGCQMGYHSTEKWDAFSMYRLADAIATGSWTLQDNGISAGGLPSYFAETLALLKSLDWTKIDIITISYGTNDFTNGLQPVVTNNPDSGNNKFKAVATAMQYSIETILNAYPNIRIFICLPMYRVWLTANNEFDYDSNTATHTSWVGSPDGAEHTFIEFVEAERGVAKANQLPIIDNYYELGINQYNWTQYFPYDDGTHHNQTGRNLIAEHMADKLW